MAVTATMDIRFRNPAPATGRYLFQGNLVERRGRRLVMEAACSVDGRPIAEAKALFIATQLIAVPVTGLESEPRQRSAQGKTETSATPSST